VAFSLFRRETNEVARRERLEQLERRVVDSFRQLSSILAKAAEVIEARRLQRNGYERPETFLERAERNEKTRR
jgi:hypothetical protein